MYYEHKNVEFARRLRKNMTPWERKLWYCFLKNYSVPFQRQKPIGRYLVDFYCSKAKMVIELDGSGHYEPKKEEEDRCRTAFLQENGITVLRFCNKDIDQNFYGVCTEIDLFVKNSLSHA